MLRLPDFFKTGVVEVWLVSLSKYGYCACRSMTVMPSIMLCLRIASCHAERSRSMTEMPKVSAR
jgi:hypothetical protein